MRCISPKSPTFVSKVRRGQLYRVAGIEADLIEHSNCLETMEVLSVINGYGTGQE